METKKQDVESKEIEQTIVQEPMVGWFEPVQLVRTGIHALLGSLFGAYADRREVQAALQRDGLDNETKELDYSKNKALQRELWIDYVADTGDGWDATYSIAWLLARPTLTLGNIETRRGNLLILGGDQVYPTATRETYQNRFVGPFNAALPWTDTDSPHLYALPGNHDWYDGLTSFLRLFCQRRWIGGWTTRQRRSYFALQLPHRWWLWGVDIQLEADIDEPQKEYFQRFADKLKPGDRVILCTAEPSWIGAGDPRARLERKCAASHPNFTFLEQLINARNASIPVTVAGDLHHYSYYARADSSSHKFTVGGGGAYLLGTHQLPDELSLVEHDQPATYRRKAEYPSASASRRLRWRNLGFCKFNSAFAWFIGGVYLFYAWIWQSASKVPGRDDSLMQQLQAIPFGVVNFVCEVLPRVWIAIAHHPGTTITTSLIPVGMYLFASAPAGRGAGFKRLMWGVLHGGAHLFLGVALLWTFSILNLSVFMPSGREPAEWMDSMWQVSLFSAEVLASGFLLGGTLVGIYLALSNMFGNMHGEHVFSALHLSHYKNFLRMRIDRDGLTIYPIAVERVSRAWDLNPAVRTVEHRRDGARHHWTLRVMERMTASWFAPRAGSIEIKLIGESVRIDTREKS